MRSVAILKTHLRDVQPLFSFIKPFVCEVVEAVRRRRRLCLTFMTHFSVSLSHTRTHTPDITAALSALSWRAKLVKSARLGILLCLIYLVC